MLLQLLRNVNAVRPLESDFIDFHAGTERAGYCANCLQLGLYQRYCAVMNAVHVLTFQLLCAYDFSAKFWRLRLAMRRALAIRNSEVETSAHVVYATENEGLVTWCVIVT